MGVELARVVEVMAGTGGTRYRGSGYAVAAGTVLTAAHITAGSDEIQVRFNADRPDERIAAAEVALADLACDLAVVTFPQRHPGERLASVEFGLIGERAASAKCVAVGFPRFKLRDDQQHAGHPASRYRDSHQADGTISPLSNSREGTLEFLVSPPERDPDADHSPWEGMSGAPLWCGSRIVGLVSKHHRREGLNRLAASHVGHWYEVLSPGRLVILSALIGLPTDAGQLPDVAADAAADAAGLGATNVTGDGNVIYANTSITADTFTGRDSVGRRSRRTGGRQ